MSKGQKTTAGDDTFIPHWCGCKHTCRRVLADCHSHSPCMLTVNPLGSITQLWIKQSGGHRNIRWASFIHPRECQGKQTYKKNLWQRKSSVNVNRTIFYRLKKFFSIYDVSNWRIEGECQGKQTPNKNLWQRNRKYFSNYTSLN